VQQNPDVRYRYVFVSQIILHVVWTTRKTYLPHINRQTFVSVSSNDINYLNLTQNRIQTISNDSFLDFKSFFVLDFSSNIDIHLDSLQACFAIIHFVPGGSLHLRNVFSEIMPQNIFQQFSCSNILFIDLKKNNLIEIDGKIFQN
jgi:hypothetical protein